jgi:short-subunit dehydrogenase
MDLNGLTCLVTGANRGIGLAVAQRLALKPVRLLVGVRELDRYEPIAAAGALEVRPVRIDLGSRASIEACVAELGEEVDRIDLLFNNAGQFTAGLLEEQDLDLIYTMVQTNIMGPIHLTKRILPGMLRRGRGKIVNGSSVIAYLHFPAVSTYSASKAGLSGFTEALRRELRDTPVSVLHVVSGGIETEMMDQVKQQLDGHYKTGGWEQFTPAEWAERIVDAIESDSHTLGPGGKSALGKLASHLPSWVLDTTADQSFERAPSSTP